MIVMIVFLEIVFVKMPERNNFVNAVDKLGAQEVKECLFGFVSAMSIMENGQCFWEKVMEVLQREVGKEVEKRGKRMQNNIRKYTEKYKQ